MDQVRLQALLGPLKDSYLSPSLEESSPELDQLQIQWELPAWFEIGHYDIENPLDPDNSLLSPSDSGSNLFNLLEPMDIPQLPNVRHGSIEEYMPPFYPLDVSYPSLPSSPDSETPGPPGGGEISFPELADMRSEAGMSNGGSKSKVFKISNEERKLERRRERNRASQRAFRKRKEKYVQDLECHYLELRRRYEGLLGALRNIRSEANDGCCGMEGEKGNRVSNAGLAIP